MYQINMQFTPPMLDHLTQPQPVPESVTNPAVADLGRILALATVSPFGSAALPPAFTPAQQMGADLKRMVDEAGRRARADRALRAGLPADSSPVLVELVEKLRATTLAPRPGFLSAMFTGGRPASFPGSLPSFGPTILETYSLS